MLVGIDLFSGAGGMSVGAQLAGIHVAIAVEKDNNAANTFILNHPETKMLRQDITDIERISDIPPGKRIVFGGPPCQGFSTLNQRSRHLNPINLLYRDYLRLAFSSDAEWIVFENVKGLIETEKGVYFNDIIEQFEHNGYTTSVLILDASDYGVPQRRNRLFIIGSRSGIKLDRPIPTSNKITVHEAISDLPHLENGANISNMKYKSKATSDYSKLLRARKRIVSNNFVSKNNNNVIERYCHVPQGGNWQDIPKHLMSNYNNIEGCHTGLYYRLDNNRPSIVISNFRKNLIIHPTENRGISIREAARLQSFPDKFVFTGSIGFQQQQVSNAVPPLLAKAIFDEIMRYV